MDSDSSILATLSDGGAASPLGSSPEEHARAMRNSAAVAKIKAQRKVARAPATSASTSSSTLTQHLLLASEESNAATSSRGKKRSRPSKTDPYEEASPAKLRRNRTDRVLQIKETGKNYRRY